MEQSQPERALDRVVERLPFFEDVECGAWTAPSRRATLAWVAHPPEQTGGVSYVHAEPARFALFSGRPIRWSAADRADGRGVLDVRQLSEGGLDGLDGRAVVASCDDQAGRLELWTDPLGAYPVFEASDGDRLWLSNNPAVLRDLARGRDMDLAALAGLLGGGWPLDGHPVWSAVRRVERGAVLHLAADGGRTVRHQLPAEEIVGTVGQGLEQAAAAAVLSSTVGALADWPGRPSLVPVTGGRDSRLVLGAALAAGIEFATATGGASDDPDVVAARELCAAAGLDHSLLPADPDGDVFSEPERAAELLGLTAGGTASLADASGFPHGPRPGPLALWHSGQGGEVARGYYHPAPRRWGALTDHLLRRYTGRRPGRSEPLSAHGRALLLEQLGGWVEEQRAAGAAAADLPDLFYLLRRMGTWAGPTHGAVEPVRDTTSPLWSFRLLPHLLGLPARERDAELFHLRVLRELAPDLVDVAFADRFTWSGPRWGPGRRAARARGLAVKALARVRPRARNERARPEGPGGTGAPGADPFATAQLLTRKAAARHRDHPAWEVLDRARVAELLVRPPGALDTMSRYYVWRLATVFLSPDLAEP